MGCSPGGRKESHRTEWLSNGNTAEGAAVGWEGPPGPSPLHGPPDVGHPGVPVFLGAGVDLVHLGPAQGGADQKHGWSHRPWVSVHRWGRKGGLFFSSRWKETVIKFYSHKNLRTLHLCLLYICVLYLVAQSCPTLL